MSQFENGSSVTNYLDYLPTRCVGLFSNVGGTTFITEDAVVRYNLLNKKCGRGDKLTVFKKCHYTKFMCNETLAPASIC